MEELGKFPLLASFAAGIMTFVSPCILPLIPAYISFITGASIEDLKEKKSSLRQSFLKSAVFVLGFGTVFIILGLSAGWLGNFFSGHRDWLRYIGGTLVMIFGFHIAGIFRINLLYRQVSVSEKAKSKAGWAGVFFIGAAFALGWTPCVGPVLASILILASAQEGASGGFWLLLAYSAGLGVPFILTSLLINRFFKFFDFIKKYYKIIEIISGILLICVGILIIADGFTKITQFILIAFSLSY
jgi:cytochrome c-type biogenesis protein